MPVAEVNTKIFDFVHVRPPQTPSPEQRETGFILYAALARTTPLLAQLQALPEEQRQVDGFAAVSAAFIESPDHALAQDDPAALVAAARSIIRAASHAESVEEARQAVALALGSAPSQWLARPTTPQTIDALWDSLIASCLAVDQRPEDREGLVEGLRAIAVIEALGGGDAVELELELVRRRATAVPALPAEIFRVPRSSPATDPEGGPIEGPTPGDSATATLEGILRIRSAIAELERALRAPPSSTPPIEPRATPLAPPLPGLGHGAGGPQPEPTTEPPGPVPEPGHLDEAAIEALSPQTQQTLAELLLEPRQLSVAQLRTGLQRTARVALHRLVVGIERARITRFGRSFLSAPRSSPLTRVPASLLDAMPDIAALLETLAPTPRSGGTSIEPGSVGEATGIGSGAPAVNVLGIGDLLQVEETLLRYEAGEIAHIENVLRGEHRERVHRHLERVEETLVHETETTRTDRRDLESTERFELQREAERTISADASLSAGQSVSASYGPVEASTTSSFSLSSSIEQSRRSASEYAKEIVDRSAHEISARVREQRTTRTLDETEETNTHGFDNREGDGHVVGIYRWVDKYYEARIRDHGKRLMLELLVPEPAAFYLHSRTNRELPGVTLEEPPAPHGLTHELLTPDTAAEWIALYNVQGVEPAPPLHKLVGLADAMPLDPEGIKNETAKTIDTLQIPDGYRAVQAWCRGPLDEGGGDTSPAFRVLIGQTDFDRYESVTRKDIAGDGQYVETLPVAVFTQNVPSYALTIEVLLERTPETYQRWQYDTYGKIITAYELKRSEYDNQVSQALARAGLAIGSNPPETNRSIERQELARSCITLLTGEYFERFDAMKRISPQGYPELVVAEAELEGRRIQFFEQAFEWDQMTYAFYPYYWGRKEHWTDARLYDDTDPRFADFLAAGAARVLLPVRPAYDDAVLFFLQSGGTLWNGGEAPTIDDPLFVALVDELRDPKSVADPESWVVKVPTTLVWLQADGELPDWSTTTTDADPSAIS